MSSVIECFPTQGTAAHLPEDEFPGTSQKLFYSTSFFPSLQKEQKIIRYDSPGRRDSIPRRFVPKGADIETLTENELQHIEDWVNNTPAKS